MVSILCVNVCIQAKFSYTGKIPVSKSKVFQSLYVKGIQIILG